jgi:hypothetical protein
LRTESYKGKGRIGFYLFCFRLRIKNISFYENIYERNSTMFIIYIARDISEARTKALIKRRYNALKNKDYDKVWKYDMAINKWRNRTFSLSSYDIWV